MTADGALVAAIFMGLLGSTHCVGMCGGISAALSFALPPEKRQGATGLAYQLAYNSGRIATYTLLGALAGLLGAGLLSPWTGTAWPRVLAGIFMIVLGLYLAGWWLGLQRLERLGGGFWKYLEPLRRHLLPVDNPLKAVVAGGFWGLLPCGLVYSSLALALTRADAAQAAATMFAFGLGTLPTLLVTGTLAGQLRRLLQSVRVRQLAGLLVIAFGIWTLLPPLLHGSHHHDSHASTDEHLHDTTSPPEHHEHGHDMSAMAHEPAAQEVTQETDEAADTTHDMHAHHH